MLFKRWSLLQRTLALSLSIALTGAIVNAVQFKRVIGRLRAETEEKFHSYSTTLGDSIAAQFYERYGDAQAFAANQVFLKGSRAEMVRTLDSYVALYGIYDLILFTDLEGRLQAVNAHGADGKPLASAVLYDRSFAKAPWAQAAAGGKFTEDATKGYHGTYFQDATTDSGTFAILGKGQIHTTFSAVVHSPTGQPIGVITNVASPRWFQVPMEELYRSLQGAGLRELSLALVNPSGQLVSELNGTSDGKFTFEGRGARLLSKPYAESVPTAELLAKDVEGVEEAVHAETGISEFVAFRKITGPKFIDSVGWAVIIRSPSRALLAMPLRAEREFLAVLFGVLLLGAVLTGLYQWRLQRQFLWVSDALDRVSGATVDLSDELAKTSSQLMASSQEQAAAIQESVAALSEMGSMIGRTAQSASQCLEGTKSSLRTVGQGHEAMKELDDTVRAIQSTNQRLQELSAVINDIQRKTGVINDIVFKTQLLSFNASIEAARAGAHGRGFSVVAEEVGNLADMSSRAAGEIDVLLVTSREKVTHTLEEIGKNVQRCAEMEARVRDSFEAIARDTTRTETQVMSISEASSQQETGIHQSNSAVKQIEVAAQANAKIAEKTLRESERMQSQGHTLRESVQKIQAMVSGHKANVSKGTTRTGGGPARTPSASLNVARLPAAAGESENLEQLRDKLIERGKAA